MSQKTECDYKAEVNLKSLSIWKLWALGRHTLHSLFQVKRERPSLLPSKPRADFTMNQRIQPQDQVRLTTCLRSIAITPSSMRIIIKVIITSLRHLPSAGSCEPQNSRLPGACAWDLTWRDGLCRCYQVKRKSYRVRVGSTGVLPGRGKLGNETQSREGDHTATEAEAGVMCR